MKILRNIIALPIGLFLGGIINMAIINNGTILIPPPEGINPNDFDSLKSNIHLFTPKNFIVPFFAHAIGTFIGALITSLIAVSYRQYLSIGIGCFFLMGGLTMVSMLPSPIWFNLIDLVFAYIPMGWLGYKISTNINN